MKPQITKLTLSLATILTLGATTVQAENILLNGSFEEYKTIRESSKAKRVILKNWNERAKIILSGNSAVDGEAKVELDNSKKVNTLTQKVQTVNGNRYTLSFSAYTSPVHVHSSDIEVIVDGKVLDTIRPTKTWADYNVTFVGTGEEQSVGFREVASQNNNHGAILDNVKLDIESNGAVNEDAIEEALKTGDISHLTREELLQATLDEVAISDIDKRNYVLDTLQHLKDKDYKLKWKKCEGSMCLGVKSYDKTQKLWYFDGAVRAIKKRIDALDTQRISLFNENQSGYRLEKLLILTADKFRQNIHFPMDKVTTNDTEFLSALFADHVVYTYRNFSPAQSDLGNFSRNDFSDVTPVNKNVKIISKVSFRATGAYALPGQTVKITRNDSSDLDVSVFINTLNPGSTHEYSVNGYIRPKYLRSTSIKVDAGQTIEITSPYGGPIELAFSKNGLPVDITFENVGEHAFWASSKDDVSFKEKLNAGNFDWAEIATSGFEVHSTLDKMRQSVAQWGSASALASATSQYTNNYPHLVAGYKGKGIDVVDEIQDFATSHGLTVYTLDKVKHMNADRSSCGSGCGGNPYDANWAFTATGHGDLHELGHGLEDRRMLLDRSTFDTMHTLTNLYSYYSRSRYNKNHEGTDDQLECQQLPFKELYESVQASQSEAEPAQYLKDNLWAPKKNNKTIKRWYYSVQVYIQAMMHTQKMGKLENGWHLLARMHILSRELNRVKGDWEASKSSIGFSTYSKAEINSINEADWTAISMSYASGLDFRPYLDMLGLSYSQKASEQIASFNYTKVPKELFASTRRGYCAIDDYGSYLDKEALPVDGTSAYPY